MKNILEIFKTKKLKKSLIDTTKRFPITLIIIAIFCSLIFLELHYNSAFEKETNTDIFIVILSVSMVFFLSIGFYLMSESQKLNNTKRNLLQAVPILFWIWFFFTFSKDIDSIKNLVFFFLTLTWILSYIYFSPYIKDILKLKQNIFYAFFHKISTIILISFILAGILFCLWAIWIWAVDTLFNLYLNEEKTYWNWAIISLWLITPIFSLTQIPKKESFNKDDFQENIFFSFLVKYILIPFISLYFFILYAYSIKVLSNFWDWPKWEVSWMVIWFSIFGYITYIFSYVFENKNKFISFFRKFFPFLVIPQIFMLFYAIYLRINQYDITINRYFVVVFGIWLLVISIYYAISHKKNLVFIPLVLTLFTIIISLWPWSIYSLPESRQLERLKTNLKKANILQTNKIVNLRNYDEIDQKLSKDIYSGIEYICGFNSCKKIKKLFPKIYQEIEKKDREKWEKENQKILETIQKNYKEKPCEYKKRHYVSGEKCYDIKWLNDIKKRKYYWPSKWRIIHEITKQIKVKKYFPKTKYKNFYINISFDHNFSLFPIETLWYSKIIKIKNSGNIHLWKDKEYAVAYPEEWRIHIIKDWRKTDEVINLKDIFKKIKKQYLKTNENKYDKKDLLFEINQNWKKYKIIFDYLRLKNPNYKWKITRWTESANGYLLY